MAGTRSQTGNARPRVFQTVDTEPTIRRKPGTTTGRKAKGAAAAPAVGTTPARGAGVTKKKTTPAKKTGGVAAKAKVAANKVEKKAAGATRAATKRRASMPLWLSGFGHVCDLAATACHLMLGVWTFREG
ncbi:uncharacterized protein F5Z01DRAFT_672023 [Emericellopsis atlantica]|uniref:Uncharacterized protein n=1 Tax=Emericellopsis atlantica TaxID=2614577 RepID=A0A9P7ZSD6_9HYPO|nr:uncharacterized protein F5Z01DRAFT_672023 [Emericellopsis atlantica]KAG9256788.1 hypothetical protein F5Z01DRAFT_672023 [Emericellopsis atlantica]